MALLEVKIFSLTAFLIGDPFFVYFVFLLFLFHVYFQYEAFEAEHLSLDFGIIKTL